MIKEILKNGEAIGYGCWIPNSDKDCAEFTVEQVYYLPEQDFSEICLRRRKQKMIAEKNNLFCHSGTK